MKKRKLYYVPGLISSIGLPVLLLILSPKPIPHPTCLRLFIPVDRKDTPGIIRFSKESIYRSIKTKKITTIDFARQRIDNGDDRTSYVFNRKMNFISQEIERVKFTNDTSAVLCVRLDANNTYGDFVWVLNQLYLYSVRKFAFADDTYIVFSDPQN